MSLIDWFAARRKDQFVGKVSQDTDEGDGLWVKCSECSQVTYRKDLISKFNVCSNCGHHNRINSDERINIIADKNSFKEFDSSLSPTDPLGFKDRRSYADRIKESQAGTGLRDGVITGFCTVNSMPLALAVMDFRFMGGSMGSVVGEKITRIIERATLEKYPILIVCASGGARMQEGMFSDDLTVSWGWMVDDLYIQKDLPVVQGIEFTELDKNISIYPNPTEGEFKVEFKDTWQGEVDCKVTDIFGRSIFTKVLDNSSSNSSHKIDIRDSNDGIYLVQLVQGDKKTMKKIIKE